MSNGAQPNILLWFPDEWRFDFTSNLHLENFQWLIEHGTQFKNTIVPSPLCAPSRACLVTGREYDFTNVVHNFRDLSKNASTIYQLLIEYGYWTMSSGKDDLTMLSGVGIHGDYRASQLGFNDYARCKGKHIIMKKYPELYDPYSVFLNNLSLYDSHADCFLKRCCKNSSKIHRWFYCPIFQNTSAFAYQDNYITDNAITLLKNKPSNKPWFLQVNHAGPHFPSIILESMYAKVKDKTFAPPMGISHSSSSFTYIMNEVRKLYAASILNIDWNLGRMIHWLENNQELENTIICVSSDHGEMLGDFRLWLKRVPWIASTNVPLVCYGPNIQQNHSINTYVTNMDLMATFLDFANIKMRKLENNNMSSEITSRSLVKFMSGEWTDLQNEYRKYVHSGYGKWRLVIQQMNASVTWKIICCKSAKKCLKRGIRSSSVAKYKAENGKRWYISLFNLIDDEYEMKNVAKLYPNVVSRMRKYFLNGLCGTNSYSNQILSFLSLLVIYTFTIESTVEYNNNQKSSKMLSNLPKNESDINTNDNSLERIELIVINVNDNVDRIHENLFNMEIMLYYILECIFFTLVMILFMMLVYICYSQNYSNKNKRK